MPNYQNVLCKLEEFKKVVANSLEEINELHLSSKSLLQDFFIHDKSTSPTDSIKIQAVIDYMYEKINIGNWKEVKPFLRKTITIASFLKLLIRMQVCSEMTNILIKELFKIIDFGILFGCPLDSEPNLLQKCATLLNADNNLELTNPVSSLNTQENVLNNEISYFNAIQLDIIDCPSMEYFLKNHILPEKPVILDNCINHWPALSKWNDQNYFIKLAGMRTVAIELGSKYTDSDWTQKLVTLEEFIKEHIYQSDGPKGYLAQYQLFDQIPELKNDIMEPEYCCFSENDEPIYIMAWYGPKGTVSPLHHDPKKNLLAQVVGEKHIFLYSPSDSECLYPHDHELLNNTAKVDPRSPNLEMYPKYKDAKAYYCKLKSGQMLYIPPKWWHFVESLSISFSVSFWWE